MLKTQYPTDHLKKEDVNSKITELSDEMQYIEQARESSQLKRYRRSDVDSESGSQIKRIDVPGDGSCLFWSVTMAYLMPVRNDDALFRQRYEALFGNEGAVTQNLGHIRGLVRNLSTANYDDTFANLVRNVFRNRVVDHISSHENEFRGFVTGSFENYLENMRKPNTWGGEPEIRAMSEMLSARISVSGATRSQYDNGNIQIQLFHVGAPGARNHYNFGLERGIVSNDIELAKGLKKVMGKGRPQDFELIQLLIEEAGKEVGISRQDEDFKSFEPRFQSFVDQIPSYLHSVEKAGFFTHFFLGSFSTLLDTEMAKKLDIKEIYFSFDGAKTLKVAIIKNGEMKSQKDVIDQVKLFVMSESGSHSYTQEFDQGELRKVLGKHYSFIEDHLDKIKVKSIEVIKDAGHQGEIVVDVKDKGVDIEHNSEVQFKKVRKGLWRDPEVDIAKLAISNQRTVKASLRRILDKIYTIHSEYADSLIYASRAREAAHHGFMVGVFTNFHYRYNLRVYPEQFAGRGYADIILLARGPDRALNSIPIIIEVKAGEGPNTTPDKALQQAEKYAQGFQPNVQRVLTTADNILCVGVNLDNPSPISDIKVSNRGEEIIPLFQDILESTKDWDTQTIGRRELKEQVKDNLERIYHTFPGTSEKGDNHYFSRFLLGQSLLLSEDSGTSLKKYIFIYGDNIPTEVHPNLRRLRRPAAERARERLSANLDASHAVVTMVLIPENIEKLVYVINIIEANRKDVLNMLNEVLPLERLNRKIGDREIVELNLNFDTRYKSDFKRYLTIWAEKYNSLQEYNNGAERFQGTFKEVSYPNELKETFDRALDIQSLSIREYSGLLEKIGEGIFPFKALVNKEAHLQAILNGVFSYYSDLKLQESPETRALVLTEFQTGGGERIDMLVHGIKFVAEGGNAEEYTPIGLELKVSRQGKGAQALLREANDQINEEYKEGVSYKTLTDGDEVKLIGVVFDKGSNNPNKLILTSRTAKEGFIPVEVVHSSVHMLPTAGQCSKGKKRGPSSPEYPPSKKPRRERSVSMACVDSRDEESVEEQERKEERVKELFDADEMKKRAKSIELYNELYNVSDRILKDRATDLEDLIKKVRAIDPSLIDSKIKDIVTEIKEKTSEKEIKDILRRSGIHEKVSKVAKDAGLTYREFLDDGVSESRNIISRIANNREAMNHLNEIGKISGWAMHGMIYKNLIGDILNGNIEGVAINLGFIAGSNALGKLANAVAMRGEGLVSGGKVFLGKSLKAASPFLARATTGFIIYDLVNQVKAYKDGNRDAMVGIVGDSVVIAVDVAEIGIEVAEVAGILSGVSSVTGPIGAAVGAIVFIGTDIYLAVKTVEREDQIIHLTGWEKFTEGLRAFVHMGPSEDVKVLIEGKQANDLLVKNAIKFLKENKNIQRYVFPSDKIYERLVEDSVSACIKRNWYLFLPGFLPTGITCSHDEHVIRLALNNQALLDKKKEHIKWSRIRPDNPSEGQLFCLPQGDYESVPEGGAYVCENAIGLSYSANRTGNYTFVDLGDGNDKIVGFKDSPHIFQVGNGNKDLKGGDKDDIFVLHGNKTTGILDGGSGINTLDLSQFALDKNYDVCLGPRDQYSRAGAIYCSKDSAFIVAKMHVMLGREAKQDNVKCGCDTRYVDTKGGTSDNPDHVIIPECSGSAVHKIAVKPNTVVDNLDRLSSRKFNYIVSPGTGKSDINLQSNYMSQQKHNFLFNSTLLDLKSIEVQNFITTKDVTFSFQSGLSDIFNVNIKNIAANVSYVLLGDNTEIKVSGKNGLYALQSTDKPINDVIRDYPTIADRLNMTIVVEYQDEFIAIGHGKHEVMNNELSRNSHLIGNGGENVYVIAPSEKEVTIYDVHEGNSIDTLDLRNVVRNTRGVKVLQDGNDLLIKIEGEGSSLKTPIRVKNGTRWYQKLHVVMDNVPMQLEHNDDNWSLSSRPLVFDESIKIVVITTKDVEEDSKLVIHKQAGQYTFSRLRDDLIITTDPSLEESNSCIILFSNFYKEPKMETLSIKFNDTTISLQEEIDEIYDSQLIFCSNALQIKKGLSINGSDLLNNYDCLRFNSDRIAFFRSNDDLLLLSDQGTSLISDYYSQIHERWNLSIELNNDIIKPEEFRERADNPSSFRYYQLGGDGLQIYHNQPINRYQVGLVDLRDRSVLDYNMEMNNGNLALLSRNNTVVEVENWSTYSQARKMMFIFNDTAVANAKCIVSGCRAENTMKEFREIVRVNEIDANGYTELHRIVLSGDLVRVKFLLDIGAKINAKENSGKTPLHLAIEKDNLAMAELLLDKNANVNAKNNNDETPLHCSVSRYFIPVLGNVDNLKATIRFKIVKLLLDSRADIKAKDKSGRTPFHYGILVSITNPSVRDNEISDLVQLFIDKDVTSIDEQDNSGNTPIHLAVLYCTPNLVQYLINKGADLNIKNKEGETPLGLARRRNLMRKVSILEEKKEGIQSRRDKRFVESFALSTVNSVESVNVDGDAALRAAIGEGNLGMVDNLIVNEDVSIYVREHSGTPLHYAAYCGKKDIVELLISKGANINAKDSDGRTSFEVALEHGKIEVVNSIVVARDKYGYTTLHYTAEEGNLNSAKLLLDNNADVNAKNNDGWTPVQLAAKNNELEMVKFLIGKIIEKSINITERNDKINAKNNYGWTVLHYAYAFSTPSMVNFLMEKGANASAKTKRGEAPLEVAREYGNLEIVNFFERGEEDIQRHRRHDGYTVQELSLGNIASQKLEELNSEVLLVQFKCLMHQQSDRNEDILQRILQESKGIEALVWLIVREYSILSLEYPSRGEGFVLEGLDRCFNMVIDKESIVSFVEYLKNDDVVPRVEEFINRVKLEGKVSNSLKKQELSRQLPVNDSAAVESMNRYVTWDENSSQNDEVGYSKEKATSIASKPSSWINTFANTIVGAVKGISQFVSSPFKPAIGIEHSQPSKAITTQDTDINSTLLLLDVFIRKITGQKYISTADQPISEREAQGYALNITEGFKQAVKQAASKSGISMHRLKIDFMEIQGKVTRKVIGGKFYEIPGVLKSYIEKALPSKKAGDPGKTNEKKLKEFMIEFNKGLDMKLNQSMQQILHNRSSTLEVNDAKEQQITLEPKSYLNNTSVQGHVTQARDLRLS